MFKKYSILVFILLFSYCKNYKQETAKNISDSTAARYDTGTNPKVDVKVNRKYDAQGNLIRFDSVYTYSYSAAPGGTKHVGTDTLYSGFKSLMSKSFDSLLNQRIGETFFSDTLYKYDFFNPDYFSRRFELNME